MRVGAPRRETSRHREAPEEPWQGLVPLRARRRARLEVLQPAPVASAVEVLALALAAAPFAEPDPLQVVDLEHDHREDRREQLGFRQYMHPSTLSDAGGRAQWADRPIFGDRCSYRRTRRIEIPQATPLSKSASPSTSSAQPMKCGSGSASVEPKTAGRSSGPPRASRVSPRSSASSRACASSATGPSSYPRGIRRGLYASRG